MMGVTDGDQSDGPGMRGQVDGVRGLWIGCLEGCIFRIDWPILI